MVSRSNPAFWFAPLGYLSLFKPAMRRKHPVGGWKQVANRRASDRESWIFYHGRPDTWPDRYFWERHLRHSLDAWNWWPKPKGYLAEVPL